MVANILRKYDQAAAKEIIERSFGTYLLSQQESADQESEVGVEAAVRSASEQIREMERSLDGRDIQGVRAYVKLNQRIAADQRIERYLVAQRKEQEVAVMESLLPFARIGSAVLVDEGLGDGDGDGDGLGDGGVFGALLGEAPPPMDGGNSPLNLVVVQGGGADGGGGGGGGRVVLVEASNVRQLDLDDSVGLTPAIANDLCKVVESARVKWQRDESGVWSTDLVSPNGGYGTEPDQDLAAKIATAAASIVPLLTEKVDVPGEIMSQRSILDRLRSQLEDNPLHDDPEKEKVLEAATQMTALELELKKLLNRQERQRWKEGRFSASRGKNAAWQEFQAVSGALQQSDALDENGRPQTATPQHLNTSTPQHRNTATPTPSTPPYPPPSSSHQLQFPPPLAAIPCHPHTTTLQRQPSAPRHQPGRPNDFGNLIASINADNELWLAQVLLSPAVRRLKAPELASLVSSIITEYTRPDTFTLYGPSVPVMGVVEELEPMATNLIDLQFRLGVDQPVNLNPVLSGLVESWASGCDWAELCSSTSLDQGESVEPSFTSSDPNHSRDHTTTTTTPPAFTCTLHSPPSTLHPPPSTPQVTSAVSSVEPWKCYAQCACSPASRVRSATRRARP